MCSKVSEFWGVAVFGETEVVVMRFKLLMKLLFHEDW